MCTTRHEYCAFWHPHCIPTWWFRSWNLHVIVQRFHILGWKIKGLLTFEKLVHGKIWKTIQHEFPLPFHKQNHWTFHHCSHIFTIEQPNCWTFFHWTNENLKKIFINQPASTIEQMEKKKKNFYKWTSLHHWPNEKTLCKWKWTFVDDWTSSIEQMRMKMGLFKWNGLLSMGFWLYFFIISKSHPPYSKFLLLTYNKQLKEKFETFIQVFASTNQIKPM